MAHLIQPIAIDSFLYCVNEQGNMRTEGLVEGEAAFQSESLGVSYWTIAHFDGDLDNGDGYGKLKFGTSCAAEVTIALTTDGATSLTHWEVTVNGVFYASDSQYGIDDSVVITLTPSPCGNIIEIEGYFQQDYGSEVWLAAAISF